VAIADMEMAVMITTTKESRMTTMPRTLREMFTV
jgi:hypothetical protein